MTEASCEASSVLVLHVALTFGVHEGRLGRFALRVYKFGASLIGPV